MGSNEFKMFENWDKDKQERALMELLNMVPPEAVRAARKKRTERVPIQDYIEAAKEIRKWQGKVQGLSTGFKGVDDLTMGMTGGELIVISGATSAGKTQLTTHIAYNVAKRKHKVLFVTMEMTKPQMTDRFMAAGGSELEELDQGIIEYQKEHDLASTDINFLVSDAVKDGAQLVVIDHLQYFSDDEAVNEANSLGRIVKDFKLAAVAHDVPIILICHIKNLPRPNQKPTGNDLRGSSLIGQHADQIIMVWRDNTIKGNNEEVEVTNWKNRLRGLENNRRRRTLYSDGARLIESRPASLAPSQGYAAKGGEQEDVSGEEDNILDIFPD